jgi:hypothetical protein
MSIGRAQKFLLLLAEKLEVIKAEFGGKPISEIEVMELFGKKGDWLFGHITEVINWLFEYKNDNFQPLTTEWVKENFAIRLLLELVEQIADQNQMGWLVPFFQESFLTELRKRARTPMAN